nr:glutamate-rich protein 6 [Biomphalaria glabrata]
MENQTKNEHLSDCDSDEDSDEYIYEEDILLKDNYNRQQSSDTIERKKCSEKFSSKSGGKDEKSNDSDNKKSSKIRTKKLKRFSESKTAFDGRKVIFTTEFTQTDWSWKDNAELSGQATIIASRNGKSNSRQTSGKTHSEGESTHEDRTVTDLSPFSLQPNDEFGIPLTDVSTDSDSDCTDIETPKKMKPLKSYPPLVGPPLILKYIGESELPGTEENPSLSNHDGEADLPVNQVGDFDEYGNAVGMFSGVCEFCGKLFYFVLPEFLTLSCLSF